MKLEQFDVIDLPSSNVISEHKRHNRRSNSPKHDIKMIREQDSDKESESSCDFDEEISIRDFTSQYKSDTKLSENKSLILTKQKRVLLKNKSSKLRTNL